MMEAMDEHAQHMMLYGIVLMDHGDMLFLMTYSQIMVGEEETFSSSGAHW